MRQMRNLTGQINLLALSAANEAPLAGSKPVASDARKLADDFYKSISDWTTRSTILLRRNAALKLSENSAQVDDSTLFQAETNIDQTLSHLSLALTHYRDDV